MNDYAFIRSFLFIVFSFYLLISVDINQNTNSTRQKSDEELLITINMKSFNKSSKYIKNCFTWDIFQDQGVQAHFYTVHKIVCASSCLSLCKINNSYVICISICWHVLRWENNLHNLRILWILKEGPYTITLWIK